MTDTVIEIRDVFKAYKRGAFVPRKEALRGISLDVHRGEVFGFLGPNGAGKTTTIKILLNFIYPSRGTVKVLGQEVGDNETKRKIGYLPETANYYPFLTLIKTLRMYGKICGLRGVELEEKIAALLKTVGLELNGNDTIGTFSKGMMQRIGIAQAMINDPELLILDEPASGLDPLGKKEVRDAIRKMRDEGKSIFFSSHELSEVEAVCDRAAIISKGKILREGTLDEMLPYGDTYRVMVRLKNNTQRGTLDEIIDQVDREVEDTLSFRTKKGLVMDKILFVSHSAGVEVLGINKVKQSLEKAFTEIIREEERDI